MAKATAPARDTELYEVDFAAWVERQVELLRARRFDDLDLEHLIEEVADLGVSERKTVFSHARRVIQHLLKLEFSPAAWPRRGWRESVIAQRTDLEQRLTPTLRRQLEASLAEVHALARRDAAKGLQQDRVAEAALPRTCPYTLEQILDPDWYPTNVHGLDDPSS